MPVAHDFRKAVMTIDEESSTAEAARRIRDEGYGCLVVTGVGGHALGVVTDRDLAIRVLAAGLDPVATRVRDVMSWPVVVASPTDPLEAVIDRMHAHGIRRLPIVVDGRVAGIVCHDDVVRALSTSLDRIARNAARPASEGRRTARAGAARRAMEEELEAVRGTIERHVQGERGRRLLQEFDGFRDLLAWTLEDEEEPRTTPAGAG